MTKKTSYWQKKLTLQKIPNSKVNNIHEAIENSQIRNRKMILNYKDRKVRKLLISGNPLNFSFSKKTKISKKSPDLNEHKEDIIKFLKLS
jgi:crotonobetainyl-CoA:carnitine CoA-transferase CaiB-like acyl-CoA transferase